ncbi:hypothetical protein SAMN04487770_11184 [Butyrivibrio sp. ob235]|uniref:DUF6449 domain-containing protein n=1 Tax=Butyrivibrio sp. ob235 TaxID=1761780 RepID=UPI0008CF50F9|nr:DUF6449 domain-containing protein [Butyrivibrio sp. ob235]SEL51099.1 hypothetical protein SAMN04487770_11184 [Butyrivibrio sp. ob235]
MTSKRLFADLLKENSKRRLWPIALSISANFFAQIVLAVLMIGRYKERIIDGRTTIYDVRGAFYYEVGGMQNVAIFLILLGLSLLIALQGYSYLFDSRQTDLYYSLPVKRTKLFDVANLMGIIVFAVPYIICHIITVFMGLSRGYVEAKTLPLYAASALIVILVYIMFYEVCVLAAVLTGHVVIAALGCGVFFFLGPVVATLKEVLMGTFFGSYASDVPRSGLFKGSPITLSTDLVNALRGDGQYEIAFRFGRAIVPFILTILIAVAGYGLSRFLITKRHAEAAGKAMAFDITKPVIKVAMLVIASLGGGITMFYIGDTRSLGSFIFGMVCGLIVVHFVIETIYEFDFKASFKHFGSFFVGTGIAAVLLLALVFDIFGYESWQPMPDKVESVAIDDYLVFANLHCPLYRTMDNPEDNLYYDWGTSDSEFIFRNMKLKDMENVEKLTKQGAINAKNNHRVAYRGDRYGQSELAVIREDGKIAYNTIINVQWNMKNGKKIRRTYYVDLDTDELVNAYKAIYNSDEYKYGKFPALTMEPNEIDKIGYETLSGYFEENIGSAKMKEFLEAYREDVMNQTFDDLTKELASIEISGLKNTDNPYDSNYLYNFFIFPSFTKTGEFLKKNGIPTDWKDGQDKIVKATVGVTTYTEDGEYGHDEYWTSENTNEINDVLKYTVPESLYGATGDVNEKWRGFTYDREKFANISFSTDIEGSNETRSLSTLLFNEKGLPQAVVDLCFPDAAEDEVGQADNGNVGWTDCVSLR